MARLGTIHLGGLSDIGSKQIFNSGIGFFLTYESKSSEIFSFKCDIDENNENNEVPPLHNGIWEVEVKKGHRSIVARCSQSLKPDQILKCGFDACQKALDLISVIHKKNIILKEPGTSHVLLFKEENKYILREVSMANLAISTEASAIVKDKDGNVVPQSIKSEYEWLPAFRYYRLSQSTSDLYESYRNLYLSFESVLSQKFPLKKNEREIDWLRRALSEIKDDINLSECISDENNAPYKNKVDPVEYIIENQYKLPRLGLFHSKKDVILPHALPNPEKLLTEYRRLIKIWYAIVSKYFNTPMGGGGVTDPGFKFLMDKMFDNGFEFQVTDDPTPFKPSDSVISPLNHSVISFNDVEFKKDHALGQVLLIGRSGGSDLEKIELIHRIGIFKNSLFSGEFIDDGLFLEGVNRIEIYQTIRLINVNYPKLDF
ncbi:hypothetical protein MSSAC_1867 [Methanosarcina siciliae C2J]|uniref:Uncharacterized protein n=1 Tax=Methanosarcina siciliae C2J TaxID=1434118 RepID=A0A0E3PN56_9EURY|nr:hypothetical protein [Methanosarcina siciliae]AKB36457.1 hypothetical protein MSSAC_1867 [Methanosarcina siciliae C2J]